MKAIIIFFVINFSLTFWLLGLMAAFVHLLRLPRPWTQADVVDVLLRWFMFFAIGMLYFYNAVVHTVLRSNPPNSLVGQTARFNTKSGSQAWVLR